MKVRRTARTIASLIFAAGLFASCSTGTESNNATDSTDSTGRTRNAVASSSGIPTIVLYSANNAAGDTKIFQSSLDTPGSIVSTSLVNDVVDGNTGIQGVAYDSESRTLVWVQQTSSAIKVRSQLIDGGTPTTLYTSGAGYPYGLGYDSVNQNLVWSGINGGASPTDRIWKGTLAGESSSAASNPYSVGAFGITTGANYAYAMSGTSLKAFSLSTTSTRGIEGGAGTDSHSVVVDESNAKAYYAIDYGTSPKILQANVSGSGSPLTYVTPTYGVVAMAMKSDGSLVYANGQRAAYSPPADNSNITVVNPTNTSTSTFLPSSAMKITSMWLIEAPSTNVDPSVTGGDGYVNSVLTCNDASWADDLPSQRLTRKPETGRTYAWYYNGAVMTGVTSTSVTATRVGSYKCAVTATNFAGSTSVESNAVSIGLAPVATPDSAAPATPSSESASSGTGSATTTTLASATSVASIASISVKWTFIASSKTFKGTFTKVSGATSYSMSVTGATKKSGRCKTVKTKVTCSVVLKKGSNSIVVNAKNAAKTVVAQKTASKKVR